MNSNSIAQFFCAVRIEEIRVEEMKIEWRGGACLFDGIEFMGKKGRSTEEEDM